MAGTPTSVPHGSVHSSPFHSATDWSMTRDVVLVLELSTTTSAGVSAATLATAGHLVSLHRTPCGKVEVSKHGRLL